MISPRDLDFLGDALRLTRKSHDPNTRVGAVIVGKDGHRRVSGFNHLPWGMLETPERLHVRETKLAMIIHAEMSCLMQAARTGVSIDGGTLYLAATDDSRALWGGPPCSRCGAHLIDAHIRRIVSLTPKPGPSKWHTDLALCGEWLEEAGVLYEEVDVSAFTAIMEGSGYDRSGYV
jgi:dCMP deaminase